MKILQMCALVLIAVVLSGCNKSSGSPTPLDEPAAPILGGIILQEGHPIFVRVSMPFNKWRLDPSTPVHVAYVRVNGIDHKCSIAMPPFTSDSTTLELSKILADPPSWSPGDYRVSYVLKDFMAVHDDDPSLKKHIRELVSDAITITIIPKKDS